MTPILYSFRRCPYAMRARLALVAAERHVVLREVVLRDKPAAFLDASPSGTVPCLVSRDGVIDESLEIMIWALEQNLCGMRLRRIGRHLQSQPTMMTRPDQHEE